MDNLKRLSELVRKMESCDNADAFDIHWEVTESLIEIVYSQQSELDFLRKVKKVNG